MNDTIEITIESEDQKLENVITPPEAMAIAKKMGKPVSKTSLFHSQRAGYFISRRSGATWLISRQSFMEWLEGFPYTNSRRPRCPYCRNKMSHIKGGSYCTNCNYYPQKV